MRRATKLAEKLKNFSYRAAHSKIVKRGLALGMGLSVVLCACACGESKDPGTTDDPNHTVTDPSGENANPGTNNDPLAKYSGILQGVLTDGYYTQLFDIKNPHFHVHHGPYNPVPFHFLESRGHNVEAFKSDSLLCISVPYMIENETDTLYVSVRVENEYAGGNYYTNYILSYPLTDKEYEDLYMLHEGNYTEGPLFIQELDKQKTAKVESVANIDAETYNGIIDIYPTYPTIAVDNNKRLDFDITYIKDEYYFEMNVRPNTDRSHEFIQTGSLRHSIQLPNKHSIPTFDNNILKILDVERIESGNMEEYKENYTPIIYFCSHNKLAFTENNIINKQ